MQNEQLEIRIDGILQEPSTAERIGSNVLHSLLNVTEAAGRGVMDVLGDIATNVSLSITDAREGSQLHAAYHVKKREERIAAIARQYELV